MIRGFEFEQDGRTFVCSVEARRTTPDDPWWWFNVSGDRQRYAPFQAGIADTQKAVKAAFEHARDVDENLVDAQQTRRVLDRLVGYQISPLLWDKVRRGLSAGRVQTVALRLIVERESEINAFVPVEYWNIDANLKPAKGSDFTAKFTGIDGQTAR